MRETIERLRAACGQVVAVVETSGKSDAETLRRAARDIHTSIAELEKVQAMTEALAPAFQSVNNAVRKAFAVQARAQAQAGEQFGDAVREILTPHVRKTRCTCGKVDVLARKGYTTSSPGRTDPQCPIHGGGHTERKTCTCGVVDVTHGLQGYTEHVRGLTDPQCPIHGTPEQEIPDV